MTDHVISGVALLDTQPWIQALNQLRQVTQESVAQLNGTFEKADTGTKDSANAFNALTRAIKRVAETIETIGPAATAQASQIVGSFEKIAAAASVTTLAVEKLSEATLVYTNLAAKGTPEVTAQLRQTGEAAQTLQAPLEGISRNVQEATTRLDQFSKVGAMGISTMGNEAKGATLALSGVGEVIVRVGSNVQQMATSGTAAVSRLNEDTRMLVQGMQQLSQQVPRSASALESTFQKGSQGAGLLTQAIERAVQAADRFLQANASIRNNPAFDQLRQGVTQYQQALQELATQLQKVQQATSSGNLSGLVAAYRELRSQLQAVAATGAEMQASLNKATNVAGINQVNAALRSNMSAFTQAGTAANTLGTQAQTAYNKLTRGAEEAAGASKGTDSANQKLRRTKDEMGQSGEAAYQKLTRGAAQATQGSKEAAQAAQQHMESFNQLFRIGGEVTQVGAQFAIMGAGLTAMLEKLREGAGELDFWERKALAAVNSAELLGDSAHGTTVGFDKLKTAIEVVSIDVGKIPIEQVAQGFYYFASAVGASITNAHELAMATQIMETALKTVVIAGGDLEAVLKGGIQAVQEFGLGLEMTDHVFKTFTILADTSGAEIADFVASFRMVGPVAAGLGQDFDELAATLAVLSNVGLKGTQAGRALRQELIQLEKPSEVADAVLQRLIVTQGELKDSSGKLAKDWRDLVFEGGKFVGQARLIDILADATKNLSAAELGEVAAKISTANELPLLLALIDNEKARRDAATDATKKGTMANEELGGSIRLTTAALKDQSKMTEMFDTVWEHLQDSVDVKWGAVTNSIKAGLADLGIIAQNAILPFLSLVDGLIQGFRGWANSHKEAAETLMLVVAGVGVALTVFGALGLLVGQTVTLFASVGNLFTVAGVAAAGLGGALLPLGLALGVLVAAGVAFFVAWKNGWDHATEAVATVSVTLHDMVAGIGLILAQLGDAVIAFLHGDWETAWKLVSEAGFNAMALLAEGLFDGIGVVLGVFGSLITGVEQRLAGLSNGTLAWGFNVLGSFAEGMAAAASAILVPVLEDIGSLIADFLQGFSPPKKGPLATIDQWAEPVMASYMAGFKDADVAGPIIAAVQPIVDVLGGGGGGDPVKGPLQAVSHWSTQLFNRYLEGFKKADFAILDTLGDMITKVLKNAVDSGAISPDDFFNKVMAAREGIAEMVSDARNGGDGLAAVFERLRDLSGEIGDDFMRLAGVFAELIPLQDAYDAQAAKIEQMQQEQIEPLKAQLELLRQQKDELEFQKQPLREQKDILLEQRAVLEDQKADLDDRKAALADEKAALEDQKALLEEQKLPWQQMAESVKDQLDDLKELQRTAKDDLDVAQEKKQALSDQLTLMKDQAAQAKEGAQDELEDMKARLQGLKDEKALLNAEKPDSAGGTRGKKPKVSKDDGTPKTLQDLLDMQQQQFVDISGMFRSAGDDGAKAGQEKKADPRAKQLDREIAVLAQQVHDKEYQLKLSERETKEREHQLKLQVDGAESEVSAAKAVEHQLAQQQHQLENTKAEYDYQISLIARKERFIQYQEQTDIQPRERVLAAEGRGLDAQLRGNADEARHIQSKIDFLQFQETKLQDQAGVVEHAIQIKNLEVTAEKDILASKKQELDHKKGELSAAQDIVKEHQKTAELAAQTKKLIDDAAVKVERATREGQRSSGGGLIDPATGLPLSGRGRGSRAGTDGRGNPLGSRAARTASGTRATGPGSRGGTPRPPPKPRIPKPDKGELKGVKGQPTKGVGQSNKWPDKVDGEIKRLTDEMQARIADRLRQITEPFAHLSHQFETVKLQIQSDIAAFIRFIAERLGISLDTELQDFDVEGRLITLLVPKDTSRLVTDIQTKIGNALGAGLKGAWDEAAKILTGQVSIETVFAGAAEKVLKGAGPELQKIASGIDTWVKEHPGKADWLLNVAEGIRRIGDAAAGAQPKLYDYVSTHKALDELNKPPPFFWPNWFDSMRLKIQGVLDLMPRILEDLGKIKDAADFVVGLATGGGLAKKPISSNSIFVILGEQVETFIGEIRFLLLAFDTVIRLADNFIQMLGHAAGAIRELPKALATGDWSEFQKQMDLAKEGQQKLAAQTDGLTTALELGRQAVKNYGVDNDKSRSSADAFGAAIDHALKSASGMESSAALAKEGVAGLGKALTDANVPAENQVAIFGNVAKTLDGIRDGSLKDADAAFHTLAATMLDAGIPVDNVREIIRKLGGTLAEIPDPAKAAEVAQRDYNTAIRDAHEPARAFQQALLDTGQPLYQFGQDLETSRQAASDLGGDVNLAADSIGVSATVIDTATGSVQKSASALDVVGAAMVEGLAVPITDQVNPALDSLSSQAGDTAGAVETETGKMEQSVDSHLGRAETFADIHGQQIQNLLDVHTGQAATDVTTNMAQLLDGSEFSLLPWETESTGHADAVKTGLTKDAKDTKTDVTGAFSELQSGVEGSMQTFESDTTGKMSTTMSTASGSAKSGTGEIGGYFTSMDSGITLEMSGVETAVTGTLRRIAEQAPQFARDAVSGIANAFSGLGDQLDGAIQGLSNKLDNAFKPRTIQVGVEQTGGIPPGSAQGSLVTGPTMTLVGEDGPELILPLSKPARMQELLKQAGFAYAAGGIVGGAGSALIPAPEASGTTDPVPVLVDIESMLHAVGEALEQSDAAQTQDLRTELRGLDGHLVTQLRSNIETEAAYWSRVIALLQQMVELLTVIAHGTATLVGAAEPLRQAVQNVPRPIVEETDKVFQAVQRNGGVATTHMQQSEALLDQVKAGVSGLFEATQRNGGVATTHALIQEGLLAKQTETMSAFSTLFTELVPLLAKSSPINPFRKGGFAEGGLTSGPTVALVGEDGPELILPLSKPARMQALLKEAGLAHAEGGVLGGGSLGSSATTQNAVIVQTLLVGQSAMVRVLDQLNGTSKQFSDWWQREWAAFRAKLEENFKNLVGEPLTKLVQQLMANSNQLVNEMQRLEQSIEKAAQANTTATTAGTGNVSEAVTTSGAEVSGAVQQTGSDSMKIAAQMAQYLGTLAGIAVNGENDPLNKLEKALLDKLGLAGNGVGPNGSLLGLAGSAGYGDASSNGGPDVYTLGNAQTFMGPWIEALTKGINQSNLVNEFSGLYGQQGNLLGTRNSMIAGPGFVEPSYADGTVTSGPQVALIGEDGPELVLPLNKPGRWRDLFKQAGLKAMAEGGVLGGASFATGASSAVAQLGAVAEIARLADKLLGAMAKHFTVVEDFLKQFPTMLTDQAGKSQKHYDPLFAALQNTVAQLRDQMENRIGQLLDKLVQEAQAKETAGTTATGSTATGGATATTAAGSAGTAATPKLYGPAVYGDDVATVDGKTHQPIYRTATGVYWKTANGWVMVTQTGDDHTFSSTMGATPASAVTPISVTQAPGSTLPAINIPNPNNQPNPYGSNRLTGYAGGTLTSGAELALIGEDGPELVLPLNKPGRWKELFRQAGLPMYAEGGMVGYAEGGVLGGAGFGSNAASLLASNAATVRAGNALASVIQLQLQKLLDQFAGYTQYRKDADSSLQTLLKTELGNLQNTLAEKVQQLTDRMTTLLDKLNQAAVTTSTSTVKQTAQVTQALSQVQQSIVLTASGITQAVVASSRFATMNGQPYYGTATPPPAPVSPTTPTTTAVHIENLNVTAPPNTNDPARFGQELGSALRAELARS